MIFIVCRILSYRVISFFPEIFSNLSNICRSGVVPHSVISAASQTFFLDASTYLR